MPPTSVNVFLDTSALFAGIWSATGGARMILQLGEAGAIWLFASPQVLGEIEGALRRKAPDALGSLALLLDRSGFEVTPSAGRETVERCRALTGHPADAEVLAAAWETGVDYFVTLDREHFLGEAALREDVPFPRGTPGDFLAFFRGRVA